jgi:hypothetical protein
VSDFSGMEDSFALPSMASLDSVLPSLRGILPQARSSSYDVRLDEVEFRRLHAADEIEAVQKMRSEIQLPGTAKADPGFRTREKKETGRGSWVRSNGVTTSSAR